MATTTQDPAVQNPDLQSVDIPKDPKERALGLISALTGSQSGKLDDAIAAHHQKRLDQARRSRQEWSTYHSVLVTGTNPDTGNPLTDDEKSFYQNAADSAWGDYEKAAGVNPQTKAAVQRNKGVIDRVTQMFSQRQQPGQPTTAAPAAGGLPAPPSSSAASPPTASPDDQGLPAPPQANPATTMAQAAMDAPRVQQHMDEQRQFAFWKKQQSVLAENKIAENKALAEARAANRPVPRPVPALSIGVLDARNQRDAVGKTYLGTDGDPIDLDKLPDTMGLKGVIMKTDNGLWETRYEPFSPNQKTVTIGNETFAVSPQDVSKLMGGKAGADLGVHNVPTTRKTTDPATGQTTVSTSTPATAGLKAGSLPAPPSSTPALAAAGTSGPGGTPIPTAPARDPWDEVAFPPDASSKPTAAAAPTGGGTPKRQAPVAASPTAKPNAPPALDEQGHIPAVASPGLTPQVIEGANQLLDGSDKDKLPAKTRELSSALARKYGWEQGKFTPKEQLLLRESTTFLQQAATDPSLSVLDDTVSSMRLGQVIAGAEKQGVLGRAATTFASKGMSDKEAAFMQMYNQLVGTISGLGQLVRSGRVTEATIHRMMMELPNPTTTKDSADARKRIGRLLNEVDVALDKGTFTNRNQAGSLPPPPKAKSGGTNQPVLSEAAKAYLKSQGIPVP